MHPYTMHVQASDGAGQDRAVVAVHAGGLTLVLADGVGGMAYGDVAAERAVEALRRVHTAEAAALTRELVAADLGILRSGLGGHTTCVVACLAGRRIHGASVGDSEAWWVGPSEVRVLSANQQRKPVLGSGSVEPVAFEAPFLAGRLLLATDGLFKYAARARILETVRRAPLEAVCAALLDAARMPSGALHDDVAVIVAEPAPEATTGSR